MAKSEEDFISNFQQKESEIQSLKEKLETSYKTKDEKIKTIKDLTSFHEIDKVFIQLTLLMAPRKN